MNRGGCVVLVIGALGLAIIGCGGSSGGSSSTATLPAPSPGTTADSGSPVAAASPTPLGAPAATAVARGAQPDFFDYHDPDGRFTVQLPQGWVLAHIPTATSSTLPGNPFAAVVGILCSPGESKAQLISDDQTYNQRLGLGTADFSNPRPTTVAGAAADAFEWSGTLGDHIYVYFEGNGCAWRLLLTTHPNYYTLDAMRPVFDHVLQSFRFAP